MSRSTPCFRCIQQHGSFLLVISSLAVSVMSAGVGEWSFYLFFFSKYFLSNGSASEGAAGGGSWTAARGKADGVVGAAAPDIVVSFSRRCE